MLRHEDGSRPAVVPATTAFLILNGSGLCGMEILALGALFCVPGQFQERLRLLFGSPGIKNRAAGDQQIRTRIDD